MLNKEETREALEFIRGYVKNDPLIVAIDKESVKGGILAALLLWVLSVEVIL